MISEGFGDDLTIEEILRQEEPFFRRAAFKYPTADPDDAVQEARIAAWQSLEKNPGNRAYMNAQARQRLIQHAMRDQWFGSPKSSAHERDPVRRRTGRDSFDDPELDLILAFEGILDSTLLAYHRGEIVESINRLTELHREYVVMRFWGGYTDTEIAAFRGITRGGISGMWHNIIKPSLLHDLVHLGVFDG